VSPASVGRPHCGQYLLALGSFAPQVGQLATRANLILRRVRGAQVERAQRLRRALPQRPDELAVVGVGDLAGAVVELELLQRGERAIALFRQLEPSLLELVRRREPVLARLRLAQERQRDEHDACDGENGADHQGERQIRTTVPS
jgi:hypothetical protein